MNNTLEAQNPPTLLGNLVTLLAAHRSAYGQQRLYQRAVALVFGELFAFGRHTVTQLLLALGLADEDWSGWYRLFSRGRFDPLAHAALLFKETLAHVPVEGLYVTGVDGVQNPRSSNKFPGSSWLRNPRTPPFRVGIHRAQRFVHLAWLTPIEAGFSRAIPLRWIAAFAQKAVAAAEAACSEWQAGLAGVSWVRQQLDQQQRAAQEMLVLADGSYDTVAWWQGLPERVIGAVRTAKNRCLRQMLPAGSSDKRRKYGDVAPKPQDWLQQKLGWQTAEVDVRGRRWSLVYRVEGPYLRERVPTRPLMLVVVRGQTWQAGKRHPRVKYRPPACYLVSARRQAAGWELPCPAESLLAWLWQRWELEVAHRELQSGLGLGEKQCWHKRSASVAVQWSAWVYAVLVLAGYRTWGLLGGPARPARWWAGAQRWSLNRLWQGFRAELWGQHEFRAGWAVSSHNWPTKAAWLQDLANAVHGAARI